MGHTVTDTDGRELLLGFPPRGNGEAILVEYDTEWGHFGCVEMAGSDYLREPIRPLDVQAGKCWWCENPLDESGIHPACEREADLMAQLDQQEADLEVAAILEAFGESAYDRMDLDTLNECLDMEGI